VTASRQVVLALLLAVPLALVVAWWLATHERVPRDFEAPFRGAARYNAYYALERSLVAHGARAVSRAALGNVATLGERDLVVLGTDVRTLGDEQVDALLDWIERGGRLVFALPRGEAGRAAPLLDALGVEAHEHYDCMHWAKAGAQDDATLWCTSMRFSLAEGAEEDEFAWLWGNESDGWLLGRQELGRGAWTVAAELDFLGNASLKDPNHAALAWQVLAPPPQDGTVHLVYAADVPPFHVLLARLGWPIALPAALALLAWLWSRGERLGPLLPLPPPARRALLEHVRAAGSFAWRRGRGVALHAALARRVLAAANRRRPELLALDADALARALAEDAGVTPEATRHALAPTALAQPQEFTSAIKTLTEIDARHDR
jgi:hypothetical protein